MKNIFKSIIEIIKDFMHILRTKKLREIPREIMKKYGDFVRYFITGCCTTLFNISMFALFHNALKFSVTVSNVISVILSILFAYIVNRIFVFRSNTKKFSKVLAEMGKFISGRIFTMALELGGVYLLVNVLGQNPLLGKAETQAVVFILNFLISKYIVFKSPKTSHQEV